MAVAVVAVVVDGYSHFAMFAAQMHREKRQRKQNKHIEGNIKKNMSGKNANRMKNVHDGVWIGCAICFW